MEYADPGLGNNNWAIDDIFRGSTTRENCFLIRGRCPRTPGVYRFNFPRRQKNDGSRRNPPPRQTSCAARVAPQRCPILRMSKSIISMHNYSLDYSIYTV